MVSVCAEDGGVESVSLSVVLYFVTMLPQMNMRVSYSGYYATLPRLRGGFDSRYPLQWKTDHAGRFLRWLSGRVGP